MPARLSALTLIFFIHKRPSRPRLPVNSFAEARSTTDLHHCQHSKQPSHTGPAALHHLSLLASRAVNVFHTKPRPSSPPSLLPIVSLLELSPLCLSSLPRPDRGDIVTMCTTHVYAYAYPDGRRGQSTRPALCAASRHGQPCVDNVILKHPTQYVQYAPAPMSSAPAPVYPGSYTFPPTPPLSSTPVLYRSGDDSDRSYRSNSSSRRPRRPSGGAYVGSQRHLSDQPHHHGDGHRSSPRRERIVLVDNPPTPRTPPQVFSTPHTAPSSPSFHPSPTYNAHEQPYPSRRPVIVDERQRPFVQIDVVDAPRRRASRSSQRTRHSSASSRGSSRAYYSSSAEVEANEAAAEEEMEQRRRRREARRIREVQTQERELREKELRDQRIRRRVAEANAEISKRPAVPMPTTPGRRVSVAEASGSKAKGREAELVDALRRLDVKERRLGEDQRRAERERERDEDEAQRARLRERMVPRRRATVGPGSRRHRVLYDDGLYRWE